MLGLGTAVSQGTDYATSLSGSAVNDVLSRVNCSLQRGHTVHSGLLSRVREVVVLVSSSRSGSSVFFELMKRSPRFVYFAGELNPFLRLAGLSWPDARTGSDALSASHVTARATAILDAHLGAEAGAAASDAGVPRVVSEDLIETLYRRLSMQWPLELFSTDAIAEAAQAALDQVGTVLGRSCQWDSDASYFHALFLLKLRQSHPAINPYYYDIDRELLARLSPETPKPAGPPSPLIVEEPPFILARPWSSWPALEMERCALVVKSPSNSYRLGFLRALFHAARFRILHLTRNPGAAVNGICDGWRHWGFHSHNIGPELRLRGVAPQDRGWWKFDLPPGWQQHANASVEEVSAFQWFAAQRAIADYATSRGSDYFRVRFEDVLRGFIGNSSDLWRLRDWLGDGSFLDVGLGGLPQVMTTQPPVPGRWRENGGRLYPVLRDGVIREMARQMGYEDDSEWI